MKKIPTMFLRDPDNMSLVTTEVDPDCQWVLDGLGAATHKYDGTCCLVRSGRLYRRHEVRGGRDEPEGFVEVDRRTDASGRTRRTGWVPVGDGPSDKWHREAWACLLHFDATMRQETLSGTYELVGPKVQGNPHDLEEHQLWRHADASVYLEAPRTFEGLREYLREFDGEGLVWHHPDGRMAKIKRRDFGW